MDSEPVRNMYSTLSHKFEKLCISLPLIVRMYHDVRSSQCQIKCALQPASYLTFISNCSKENSGLQRWDTHRAMEAVLTKQTMACKTDDKMDLK